jgi:MFS family permease
MNKNLFLLSLTQGLFLTNNVVFIAINGLVGFSLAPEGWMATLPVMGYVVGGALSTSLVAKTQHKYGRKTSFLLGLLVAFISALMGAWSVSNQSFVGLIASTMVAGYYSANAQLYRFAAAELAPQSKEKAVSWVMAGGLIGAISGPWLATHTKNMTETPFAGSYICLCAVALVSAVLMFQIHFPPMPAKSVESDIGRPMSVIISQPVFIISALAAALGYGVMNLLMAATPLAMQTCGLTFENTAIVLQWHVIGMFAPGFFTGHLIKKFGALNIMLLGLILNAVCISIALSGTEVKDFLLAMVFLGVGWNFLFTGSTTLSLKAYEANEKDRAQAAINFCVFSTMAFTSFASGALVTTQGWTLLNWGSTVPVLILTTALFWLKSHSKKTL